MVKKHKGFGVNKEISRIDESMFKKVSDNYRLKNIFVVSKIDGDTMCIINTHLAENGYSKPKGNTPEEIFLNGEMGLMTKQLVSGLSLIKGNSFCWVNSHPLIKNEGCMFKGELEFDPVDSEKLGRLPNLLNVEIIHED